MYLEVIKINDQVWIDFKYFSYFYSPVNYTFSVQKFHAGNDLSHVKPEEKCQEVGCFK